MNGLGRDSYETIVFTTSDNICHIKSRLHGHEALIIDDDGFKFVDPKDVKKHPLKRIFKYPSWKYPRAFDQSQ